MEQSYDKHTKLDPIFVFGIGILGLSLLIVAFVFFFQHVGSEPVLSILLLGFALMLIMISMRLRGYALMLQDRIIRSEENFRYYRLTGKPLDSGLSLKQVIALRFAGDEEYLELVERAKSENLSPDEIKKAIRHWRADHHRV